MPQTLPIAEYLIDRLAAHRVRHVFGIPGDYILKFFALLARGPLATVICCDEQGAGFAADAYARVNGLGAVAVTYGVGALKLVNSTAQAYAEESPLIVISGAPGLCEQTDDPLLHHKVRGFDTQLRIFEQLTVGAVVLSNPETAGREIDRAFQNALRYKRPVYLELPRDMVEVPAAIWPRYGETLWSADPEALDEALAESAAMIDAARQPVILAGQEIHRLGLQDRMVELAERNRIPIASTLLGKSVICENLPLFIGVYEGAMGQEGTREYVESSDCVLSLGVLQTDLDMGMFTARLHRGKTIAANIDNLTIRHHRYPRVPLHRFLEGLLATGLRPRTEGPLPHPQASAPFEPRMGEKVTVRRLFQRINAFLDDRTVVVADPGEALFGAADLLIHSDAEFIAPAYYSSLGFAIPGAIGVQLARPELRPLVLVGDGAFQMTGMELSVAVSNRLNPIVVVLNNGGYGTERPMLDGPFNDIHPWRHARIPEIFGAGKGFDVFTEDELDRALEAARAHTEAFSILDVRLDPHDRSPALERLTKTLGQRVTDAAGKARKKVSGKGARPPG